MDEQAFSNVDGSSVHMMNRSASHLFSQCVPVLEIWTSQLHKTVMLYPAQSVHIDTKSKHN